MTSANENRENEEKRSRDSRKIFALFIAGFLLVVAGIAVLMIASVLYGGGQTSFGTVIFIGPIPIVIGAGPGAAWLVLIAILLGVLTIVFLFMMRRDYKKDVSREA